MFVSRPSPFWPSKDVYQLGDGFGKSYFSFFASWEFEIGPVVNPMPPGTYDTGHRGYNHVSAEPAWGGSKDNVRNGKQGLCSAMVSQLQVGDGQVSWKIMSLPTSAETICLA